VDEPEEKRTGRTSHPFVECYAGIVTMMSIFIPRLLQAPDQTERVDINRQLPDFATLTPVQGFVEVSHRGTVLEVQAEAETITTLTCDRCLQQFNHRLRVKCSEFIWLEDPNTEADGEADRELSVEELVETLSPQASFQPEAWLYEQLCLAIPLRKLCAADCPGIALSDPLPEVAPPPTDHRWASLEALKEALQKETPN